MGRCCLYDFEIQVQDGFEDVATELAKSKHALIWAQRKENESSCLIKDLTCMVKEQKTKLSEVSKLKQEAAANLQARVCSVISLELSNHLKCEQGILGVLRTNLEIILIIHCDVHDESIPNEINEFRDDIAFIKVSKYASTFSHSSWKAEAGKGISKWSPSWSTFQL